MQEATTSPAPTLEDAVNRYIENVCPLHKGCRWEIIRLKLILRTLEPKRPLNSFRPKDFSAWRDHRLKQVKPASVAREMSLISSVFEEAKREWEWVEINPLRGIRRPPTPHHRERVINQIEVDKTISALGYVKGTIPKIKKHEVAVIFLIALETGMRSGEICGLTWDNVLFDKLCFRLPTTKNGHSRLVPMLGNSRELVELMLPFSNERKTVFSVKVNSRDTFFREAKKKAGLSEFTFHDGRHTAATHISGKLKSGPIPAQQALLDLCKILGWKDVNQSLKYYNPTPVELIQRLEVSVD